MQKKKNIAFLLLIVAVCFLVTGCGKKAELEKNSTIVKYDGGKIKAETLYENLRDKYGISILIDMIDHSILDKKYKTTDEETTYVDNQITKMKSQYNNDDDTFLAAIKQYLGVDSVDELRNMIALEYKRNLAVEDYIKDNIKDDEIQKYYDEEIIGDMKVRHILIKPKTTSDMSTEEKEDAEKKALEKAKKLIKQLDEGADFAKLAKKNSDDTGSKSDGGLIDYFNKDSGMDEAFLNASINLEKGKYTTEPVKSAYGYHIILKVDQKKKASLKKSKDTILEKLTEEKLNNDATLRYETLIEVRKKAGVEFKDDSLKKDYDEYMDKLIENAKSSSSSSSSSN